MITSKSDLENILNKWFRGFFLKNLKKFQKKDMLTFSSEYDMIGRKAFDDKEH